MTHPGVTRANVATPDAVRAAGLVEGHDVLAGKVIEKVEGREVLALAREQPTRGAEISSRTADRRRAALPHLVSPRDISQ